MTDVKVTTLDKKGWDLDKKIPVALIVTMVLQTVTFLVVGTAWVTQTNARLTSIETFVQNNASTGSRLATIEAKIDMLMSQYNIGNRKQ